MSNKRDLRLGKYDISNYKYRELLYFCRQYNEWKKELKNVQNIGAVKITGTPSAHTLSDTTADAAMKRAELSQKCEIIEQTAIEADASIYQYIIKNATEGTPYEYMDIPCGRRQFYIARRKFFYLLAQKR